MKRCKEYFETNAIKGLKNVKAPGLDKITAEVLWTI